MWLKLVKPLIGKFFWTFRVFFVTIRHFFENSVFYIRSKSFFLADLKRFIYRLFFNPYRQIRLYGITPLKTFDRILKTFYLTPKSRFVDLGCSDGRLCQFAHTFYQTKSTGLDLSLPLIEKARKLEPRASFLHQDFLNFDFTTSDFVYFFSTGFSQEDFEQLKTKLLDLKKGAKVITVSERLFSDQFYLWKQLKLSFVFGRANVYCYIRK